MDNQPKVTPLRSAGREHLTFLLWPCKESQALLLGCTWLHWHVSKYQHPKYGPGLPVCEPTLNFTPLCSDAPTVRRSHYVSSKMDSATGICSPQPCLAGSIQGPPKPASQPGPAQHSLCSAREPNSALQQQQEPFSTPRTFSLGPLSCF